MVSVLQTCILVLLVNAIYGANSPFYWRPSYSMAWLRGPNVCALQEVRGTRERYFDECMVYRPRNICGYPTVIRYYCCSGYEKFGHDKGCTGVRPMENMYESIKNMKLRRLAEKLEDTKLDELLETGGAFTMFAPVNRAFVKLPDDVMKQIDAQPSLLNYHIVPGRYNSTQLMNGVELESLLNKKKLRINRYSNGIITVNCARMLLPNVHTTNGIIHTLDRVVTPIDKVPTVAEVIINDNKFRQFVTLLINSGLVNQFRSDGPYTIFAPTDKAISKMPQDLRDSIFNNRESLRAWLKYHIVKHTLCSVALVTNCGIKTLEGSKLNITCGPGNKLYVDGSLITEADLLASNGVVHAIDYPLIPDSSRDLRFLAAKLGLKTFVGLAGSVDLNTTLSKVDGQYYTVFVPTEEAFAALTPAQLQSIKTNPDVLTAMLKYHIVPGQLSSQNFVSEQLIETEVKSTVTTTKTAEISGSIDGSVKVTITEGENIDKTAAAKKGVPPTASIKVRISMDRDNIGINEARVISKDHRSGNGYIHVIDKVMLPPEKPILDLVKKDKRLGSLSAFIQSAGLEDMFSVGNGNYTLFAPTDDAFSSLEPGYMESILRDPKKMEKVIRHHVLDRTLFTCAVKPDLKYRFETNLGEKITLQRDTYDKELLRINKDTRVINSDVVGTNGVVYVIDRVLRCECPNV